MKFVFFLVFWFHLQSCIWWAVILRNKDLLDENGESYSWIPPVDFIDHRKSYLLTPKMTLFKKYSISFYTSVLMLGNNELAPKNLNELKAAYSLLVASLFLNSQIFGEIASLIVIINSKSSRE